MKFLPDFQCKKGSSYTSFRIFGIDVQDGKLEGMGDIGAIKGGTPLFWGSCKSNLIIDNQMNGATCFKTGKFTHLQGLIHNSLPR